MTTFELARDIDGSVLHDIINKTMGRGKQIPHEWYFLNILGREEILNDREIAKTFIMYVMQYYPDYKWHFFKRNDYLATAVCECELLAFQFQKKYEFDLNLDETEEKYLNNAMQLGDIIVDFLIRYRNYSLIKCSGQKIILTAQSDCHKRFEKYLSQGYALQRRAKVGLSNKGKECFYKLPVLPTRDIGYPIDEIIEMDNGKYSQVLQLRNK